ncbi:glycosyltransferase family 4 protein [Canibacter zhoujuaniae]|uniref:glycosyltransferase family 4 protein n=1 Tax=Canibacter zhoujuaniae TaxID=2708343 RepID=UPI001420184D|nr:glycosyltransferase family 4 protein [Canibacter zhoujuaniae]
MSEPRVLHFHDCADVGAALVKAAGRVGYDWGYLGAEAVRPTNRPKNRVANMLFQAKLRLGHMRAIRESDVLHVHYGTAVSEARRKPMPKRPLLLHLHGTDIRTHWARGRRKSRMQGYIDQAEAVFYTNLDTQENAEEARPDAQFMPAFIDPDRLTTWQPDSNQAPKIIFLSRWEEIKGASRQWPLIKALTKAYPEATIEGLDWGADAAAAAKLGVRLVPKMDHTSYMQWIGGATVAIGQANPMLGVSEFEAMAMGLPVAVLGSRLPRPDDGSTPPVFEGSVADVVEQIGPALHDPVAAANNLNGRQWVLDHHLPDPYIPMLQSLYRKFAA